MFVCQIYVHHLTTHIGARQSFSQVDIRASRHTDWRQQFRLVDQRMTVSTCSTIVIDEHKENPRRIDRLLQCYRHTNAIHRNPINVIFHGKDSQTSHIIQQNASPVDVLQSESPPGSAIDCDFLAPHFRLRTISSFASSRHAWLPSLECQSVPLHSHRDRNLRRD